MSNDLGGRMHGEENIRIAVAGGGTGGLSAALVCCTVEALDTIEGTMVSSDDDQQFQLELILDAASRLCLRHGFIRVSMEELAVELGMSKQRIYRHFADRLIRGALNELCASDLANQLDWSATDLLQAVVNTVLYGAIRPAITATNQGTSWRGAAGDRSCDQLSSSGGNQ